MSRQPQYRHVFGYPLHNHGGYLVDEADAQRVLTDAHSGIAQFVGVGKNGWPLFRHPDVRGVHRTKDQNTGLPVDVATDTFFIKGTTKVSIVPTRPGRTN